MNHHYAEDGRTMTPPTELKPLLGGAFAAFSKLLGHVRWRYIADEIWDGASLLGFCANGEPLLTIVLGNGVFDVHIDERRFPVENETALDAIFGALETAVRPEWRRPIEQRIMNTDDPTKFPCGYRCDMCLLHKSKNENDFTSSTRFVYWNWLCYHNCVPGIHIEKPDLTRQSESCCPGCASVSWKNECRSFQCPTKRGHESCMECGEYHTCETQRDGHCAAQCNLGMTAEEVTALVIPYCAKERFDTTNEVQHVYCQRPEGK